MRGPTLKAQLKHFNMDFEVQNVYINLQS